MSDDLRLLPSPSKTERRPGVWRVAPGVTPGRVAECLADPARAGERLDPSVAVSIGGGWCGATALDAQAYTLEVSPTGVRIESPTNAGARHGLATLAQLLRTHAKEVPCVRIEDRPAFATRGVMLDVSRTRVPTMAELFETIDRLALLKVNHLQLYTEHTFAYAKHEDVWRGCSPITPDEVRRLDAYAKARGVELAANQNCFGHLRNWLEKPAYRQLAETHGDWVFDVWPRSGPFSLCPTDPASERFVRELMDELLPCFSSPLVNIGCDETYDIAYGRSKDEVARRGRAAVYLEFVAKIAKIAESHGKRAMFWGDIALSHPECVREIPEGLLPLAWGYEPDSPFERWGELLGGAGLEHWVCPGTSSWRSIFGRTSERRANIEAAAKAGLAHGATGFLMCDWGDTGHHQQWPVVMLALAHGASAGWTGGGAFHAGLAGEVVFGSGAAGAWLEKLGDSDLALRRTCLELSRPGVPGRLRNQSALFIDMHKKWDEQREVGRAEDWIEALESIEALAERRPSVPDRLVDDELVQTLEMARFASARAAARRGVGPGTSREELRAWARRLTAEHRRLWLARSRTGGLEQSCGYWAGIDRSME